MEVSTVSPPPTSPTEGDDLCDTDVTDVALECVMLLIGLCGLAGNGAVLWLLGRKGRVAGIFYLAVIDFLFLLFVVPSALLFLLENASCSPIMPQAYVFLLFQLPVFTYYCGLILLTPISIAMGVYKPFQLCCRSHISRYLLWVVPSIQLLAFLIIPTVTLLCPEHKQEHCRVALTSMFVITLLLFPALMVISHTVIFIKAKCGPQQQQPKRRDIVIFLLVFFTFLLGLWIFLQRLGYIVVSSQVVFLLTCIYSSIKPFIYFLAGRCWRHHSVGSLRESLRRVFVEPEEPCSSNDVAMDTVI